MNFNPKMAETQLHPVSISEFRAVLWPRGAWCFLWHRSRQGQHSNDSEYGSRPLPNRSNCGGNPNTQQQYRYYPVIDTLGRVSFLPNLIPKITQVAGQWCMALCRCRQEFNTKKFSAMRGWKPQLKDLCTQEETGWTYRFMKNLVLPLLSILVFYSHFTWNSISVILLHLYPEIQVNSCRYTVREFGGTNGPLPLFSRVWVLFLSRNRSYTEPSQHAQAILQGWGSCLSSARLPRWPLLEPQPWPYFLLWPLYQTHREWRSSKKYGLSQGYSVNSPGPQLPHQSWLSFI